jgi:VWFA-related protein
MTRACVLGGLVLAAVGLCAADLDGQAGSARSPQSFTSTTTAILVDVVVRDRGGRPVTDLTAADFDIAEDGVHQTVDSFTRVSHGGGIGVGVAWRSPSRTTAVMTGSPTPPPTAADGPPEEATTALVFDHLSADTLRLAQKATLAYVPMSGDSSVRVGVFATEPAMHVVQRYTTERALVRQAVARVQPSGVSLEEQSADRSDELTSRRRQLEGETQATSAGVTAGTGAAAVAQSAAELGERETELALVRTEEHMLRSFDNFDRATRGYDTSSSLLAVVQTLSNYPGRKTIVLFSEGLPVSPSLTARLDSVIDAANRANVTAYAVDAKGLRARSSMEKTRKELDSFAEDRLSQLGAGREGTGQPLSMAMERVEDTLKLDSRAGLARLAQDTGGFLIEQTNDLSSAFRRIDEDTQFHYLLTYTPKNELFDGRFHAIHVKVGRPGMQVFARKGYRALHMRPSASPGSFEVAALALLGRAPLPNAFPIQAGGFSFPDPGRPGLSPVLVRVSTESLRFDVDAQRSTYAGQVAVVVRLRDGEGHDVQTLSQQYVLTGEAKDVEAAKKGEILFYREPDLPPGVYTMESIVLDEVASRGSVRMSTLTVPARDRAALGMSSLVLVTRVEEMRATAQAPDGGAAGPLYVGRTLLYPNLGEPIRKTAGTELPFYFALYGNAQGVTVTAQLLRNGQRVAEGPVQLAPSSGPRIQHVGRLSIGALAAGTYELRIGVNDGVHNIWRTAYFTLTD